MGDDRLPSFPALDPTAVPSRSWTLRPWRRLPKPNRKGKRDLPFPPFFRGEWLKFGSVPTHFISGFLFYQVERPPKMVCFLWRDLKSGYCWEATDYQKRTSQLSQMLNVWFIHSAIWGSLGGGKCWEIHHTLSVRVCLYISRVPFHFHFAQVCSAHHCSRFSWAGQDT